MAPDNPAATLKAALKYRNLINPVGLQGFEGIMGPPSFSPNVQNDFYQGTACDSTTPYGSWNGTNHVWHRHLGLLWSCDINCL